jgi:hypothetical protein
MKRFSLTIAISLLTAASALDPAARQVRGAVIFDNNANTNPPFTTLTSSDTTGLFILAEDFTLMPGASTVTGVEWSGSYASAQVHLMDDFTIQFFDNAPPDMTRPFDRPMDLPNFIVEIAVANSNRAVDANGLFQYSATFAPVPLLPNTLYWVSIFNNASNEPDANDGIWLWAGTTDGISLADRIGIRTSPMWGSGSGFRQDFRLLGDMATSPVPEVAGWLAWSLLAAAATAIYAVKRTRRSIA